MAGINLDAPDREQSLIRNERLFLFAVLALAALLRFWSVDFGLPGKFRPDEEYLVSTAIGFHHGHLRPGVLNYPTLYMYFTSVVFGLFRILGSLFEWFEPGGFNHYLGQTMRAPLYLLGRYTTAAVGVVSVYAVFRLGKTAYNKTAGLLAAAILAVTFIHVRDSHFFTVDVPAALMCTCSLAAMLPIVRGRGFKAYIYAGIWTGLAVSTKYTSVALGVPFACAHIMRLLRNREAPWARTGLRDAAAGFVVTWTAFLVGSPYVLLDQKKFAHYYHYVRSFAVKGLSTTRDEHGWGWTLGFWRLSLGTWLFMAVLAGMLLIAIGVIRNSKEDWPGLLLCTFVGTLIVIYARAKWVPIRYMVLLMPMCAVLAARALLPAGRIRWRGARFLIPVLLVVVCWDPAARSVALVTLLSRTDTRCIARAWIREHVPPKAAFLKQYHMYGKPLLPNGCRYIDLGKASAREVSDAGWALTEEHPITHFARGPGKKLEAVLKESGVLVATFDPFTSRKHEGVYDRSDAFYAPLDGFEGVERPGTLIKIYRLKEDR